MSEYIDSQLQILNGIFTNSINNECNNSIEQISGIKLPLFQHQLATIHEMKKKMFGLLGGETQHSPPTLQVFSKMAILANSENSGKTLTILGFLAKLSQFETIVPPFPLLSENSTQMFYCLENQLHDINTHMANIIIVPNYLFSQWQREIELHTDLEFAFIDSKKSLNHLENLPKNFLVSAKIYKNFLKYSIDKKITWNVLIFDEVPNIYINSNECYIPISTRFIWFSTSNWLPLIFKQSYFSFQQLLYRVENNLESYNSELHAFLEKNKNNYVFFKIESSAFFKNILPINHLNRETIVVRCTDNFINNSMKSLRTQINITIQSTLCRPSVSLLDIRRFFNENDVRADNLMPVFYKDLEIKNINPNTCTDMSTIYYSEDCPICLEVPNYPVLSNCCRHTYCASCILKNTILRGSCPLCRKINTVNNLIMFDNSGYNTISLLDNKLDTTYKFICDNSESKILIFSSHKNILYNLQDTLLNSNIVSQIINSKEYNSTKNILLFTCQDFLSGLKIKNINNIIIMSDTCNIEKIINYIDMSVHSCKVLLLQETMTE